MLIQAAWAWHRRDPYARQIYSRLIRNTGNSKKAIVGLAKRIAIHLWQMLGDGEDRWRLVRVDRGDMNSPSGYLEDIDDIDAGWSLWNR